MKIRSITEVKKWSGKRVLVRADFNVPVKKGKVMDIFKIEKSLATIEYLQKRGARIVLISHLGRPKGYDTHFSLRPIQRTLQKALSLPVGFIDVKNLEKVPNKINALKDGEILLLENIRFISGEETNDQRLAKKMASWGDVFVLDGFAVAHRNAASVSGVARYMPSYAGLLLKTEVDALSKIMEKPTKPFVVIIGGAKVETKLPLIKQFIKKATYILVGGGILDTYLSAKGFRVGASLVNTKLRSAVLKYGKNKKIIWPVDVVVGELGGDKAAVHKLDKSFGVTNKREGIYDVGPATVRLFASYIKRAKTLLWNGPLGVIEQHPYASSTNAIADIFAARSKGRAFGVTGGGETVQLLQKRGILSDIDLVSTGGGAMLEFLSGEKLPGLKALQ